MRRCEIRKQGTSDGELHRTAFQLEHSSKLLGTLCVHSVQYFSIWHLTLLKLESIWTCVEVTGGLQHGWSCAAWGQNHFCWIKSESSAEWYSIIGDRLSRYKWLPNYHFLDFFGHLLLGNLEKTQLSVSMLFFLWKKSLKIKTLPNKLFADIYQILCRDSLYLFASVKE